MRWGRERVHRAVRAMMLGAVIAGAAAGCRPGRDARAAEAEVRIVTVGVESVALAELGDVVAGPVLSGTLTAEDAATLRAELSGPVVAVPVQQGDQVRRGQVLARIDDITLRESLLSARSGARSAESAAQLARRDAERMRTLQQGGAVSLRDVESAERGLVAAEAALADARARLAMTEQQLARSRIVAPFDGIVSEKQVSAGDVVQPGTAMLTVVDPARLRLEAVVPVGQLEQLRVGAPVGFTVSGFEGRQFDGRVERINPSVDAASRQVRVYVSVPNADRRLVAGLYAQGRVATETRTAITVPVRAVDLTGLRPTVVRLKDGSAELVTVTLGLRDDRAERVEVVSGLAAGDTLLLGSAAGVVPGTRVRVLSAAEQPAR